MPSGTPFFDLISLSLFDWEGGVPFSCSSRSADSGTCCPSSSWLGEKVESNGEWAWEVGGKEGDGERRFGGEEGDGERRDGGEDGDSERGDGGSGSGVFSES